MKNPQGLTQNQHIFPKRSIERFCDNRGFVQVRSGDKQFPSTPKNDLFCANRLWNQQAENGFPKHVEDVFQAVADAIIEAKEVAPEHGLSLIHI